MDAPPSSAPSSSGHSRAIRSFALREDADRACVILADSDINSTVREFIVPDRKTGKPVSRGCSLYIDPADAKEATRILLKMAPSEAPVAAGATAPVEQPSRLIRRTGPPARQRGTMMLTIFAVMCVAGMIVFATKSLLGPKSNKVPVSTENIRIEEDLNGDTITDVLREFTYRWEPVIHAEDRNFDSMFDIYWHWQKGKPSRRDIDLNFDGKVDEVTYYDPKGQPFFVDTRPGSAGPVLVRKVYRDGSLWKMLEDRDADHHFDHLTEFDDILAPIREEELPKDSRENNPPPWPPPPAPPKPEEAGAELVEPKMKLNN